MVPGRSPHRAEERPRAAVGTPRHAASPACRSALRERLPVRCNLPGTRNWRSTRAALRRYRSHAASPRRNQPPCRQRRSRRASLDRAGWHTTARLKVPKNITPIFLPSRAPSSTRSRISGNSSRQLAFQPGLRRLRSHHRGCMRSRRNLIAQPDIITSIGMRDWAHVGQSS